VHDEQTAQRRLVALFEDGEWITERRMRSPRRDRNSFVSANVLLTLDRCRVTAPDLREAMATARAHLRAYRLGHHAHYWPLRHGRSTIANSPFSRFRFMQLSPDADSTSISHLALPDPAAVAPILDDLAFYRARAPFRLPAYQAGLPGVSGSFLTWFPDRAACRQGKLETVDVGVDAHALWFLASASAGDAEGAAETLAFVSEVIRRGLILTHPFRVAPNYASPAVVLYLIARAAVWGGIPGLLDLRGACVAQLDRCPARSALERLCLAAARRLWGAPPGPGDQAITPDGRGTFYIAPMLSWPLQRWAALEGLAAHPATQVTFSSEAFEWALWLWLRTGT